ncbi:zeta toxin family protein [Streptomyces sp. ID05-04B]|uniref:zeta toxin family protein n=1 Tax=Streptomyces sp. ID05-04B TaxID=3028661 RepID=UPI0029C44844|nr:zeta toxin family protein [Streptomyces sp. ID05-04B]MDX5569973.1 zeta toxin family protein [Streptomyces sp. ID05-04B]
MEKYGGLLAEVIVPKLTAGAVAQEHPVVVFVAGQGGSGKTLVMDLVHTALEQRGGAVRVDRDTYKTLHPHYNTFLAEDVRTAGVRVRPETYRWQAEVEAHARGHRFDVVAEEALADPAGWLAALAVYRTAGYRVEVVTLAVPEAVSQLGVLDRYLRLAEDGRARYVGWDNHDACAAALPTALAEIEAGRLADRVVVVRRAGEVLYANELTPEGRWRQPAGAREALLGERLRPWSAAETGVFRRQLADADRRAHNPQLPEDWALAVRRDGERAAALAEPLRRGAQARQEAPGVDYHRLSAEEHRWIFDTLIAPTLLEDITPQERPVAVYVMGQPGSGKTSQARVLRRALRGRPTHISGDDFKASHPDYYDLLHQEPRTAGERIRADYRAWQAMAEAAVRERRGDVTIEIAPGSAAGFVEAAMAYRRAGYRVELVVLAVRAADSRQGTAVRCADVNRLGGRGRFTTAQGHDHHFAVLADAVAVAEQEAVADSVMVWGRDGTVLYRNDLTPQGSWVRQTGAVKALLAEQRRPYTSQEAARFWAFQRRLCAELPHYRHDIEQIARLARALMPAHLQPRRLAGPAAVAALPMPRARDDDGYGPVASSSFSRAA